MRLGRLAAQWIGALIGNGFIEQHFPAAKASMAQLWLDPKPFYTMLAIQCLMGAIQGAFTLRLAQTDPKKHLTRGVLWDSIRSGTWVSLFVYPWGSPGYSVVACIWIVRAYHQPALVAIVIHTAVSVVQGVGAKLISELSFRESATIR